MDWAQIIRNVMETVALLTGLSILSGLVLAAILIKSTKD